MNKVIKKITVAFSILLLALTMIPKVTFAKETDDILSHNKSLLKGQPKEVVDGYEIKNDWTKLKLLKSSVTGPSSEWQFLEETGNFDNVGFFIPEKLDSKYLKGFYRSGSLGVTGSEIEKFKKYADVMGATDLFKKIKYPESDMSVKNESVKAYMTSSESLENAVIKVVSDLSPFKAWSEFAYTGDTATIKTTFNLDITLLLTLPKELSFVSNDIKDLIKINNTNYTVESANVVDKEVFIKLVKKIENSNISDFSSKPDNFLDIDLDVKGIKFNDEAKLNKKYTIKGSLFGLIDNTEPKNTVHPTKVINVFATKQASAGKDKESDLGSIMALTVGINHNTVTFKDDGKEDIKVLVEHGKAIEKDFDKTQSMPTNPSKASYKFKEWNTKKDGSGTSFNGDTLVNNDLTVYAIYDKQVVDLNEAPVIEAKDKTINKGDNFDLMNLVVKATDKEDGNLRDKVKLVNDGGFNKNKVGKYNVDFEVTDSKGLTSKTRATIKVVDKAIQTGDTSNIIIYMLLGVVSLGLLLFILYRVKTKK